MAYDFPSTPNVGDAFTDPISGVTFIWNGYGWGGGAAGTGGPIIVGPTPPSPPKDNTLWWENDSGMLFVRYNDGNSSQWVQVNAAGGMNNYVAKAGDAMSGLLTLSGDPAVPLGASTKQYADTKQPLAGVTDGSNAAPGQIGEVISLSNTTGTALSVSGSVYNLGSIVLTPGDWDINGQAVTTPSVASTVSGGGINFVSATLPATGVLNASRTQITSNANVFFAIPACRANVTVNTTYYLMAHANFASGTCTAYGNIIARRVR